MSDYKNKKKELYDLVSEIDQNNFTQYYSKLTIFVKNANQTISKFEIETLLNDLIYSEVSEYQDEVLGEILNCINGFCTESQIISLK